MILQLAAAALPTSAAFFSNTHRIVLDERLLEETDLGQVLVQLALDDSSNHLCRLAKVGSLNGEDVGLFLDVCLPSTAAVFR